MIGVYLDPVVINNKYLKQIKFTIDYLLNISGYAWKYLDEHSVPAPGDVIIYYSNGLPAHESSAVLIRDYCIILIPFHKDFYLQGFFTGDNIKHNTKYLPGEEKIPYISNKRLQKEPINLYEYGEHKYCVFEFDLIGNTFLQLSDDDRNHITKKDAQGDFDLNELGMNKDSETPFINYYLTYLMNIIQVLVENKGHWIIRKCLWPKNQPLATLLSHNIDKLEKWNFFSFFLGLLEIIILFLTFHWKTLIRHLYSICKYLFKSEDLYWNFEQITAVERKHNVVSTWFIGINENNKTYFDYHLEELVQEIAEIIRQGSEPSILMVNEQKSIEEIRKALETMMTLASVKSQGIRHYNYYRDCEQLDRIHHELGFKYDSTRRFKHKNGFYNGFALPYPTFIYKNANLFQTIYQLPISFSADLLRLSKYRYLPYKETIELIKQAVNQVIKVNGIFHFQLTNSLYYEIAYMPRLHQYLVEYFHEQNAYITSCSRLVQWLHKRKNIKIIEEENRVIIKFYENIEQVTFEILGKRCISKVVGVNCNVQQNFLYCEDVTKDSEVILELSPSTANSSQVETAE